MELFEGVNLYDWVTYFQELGLSLVEISKDVNNRNIILRNKASQIFDPEHILNKYEIIDPFSFIYALAQKNNVNRRVEIYQNTIDAFSMNVGVPTDTIFPSPANNAKVCFYTNGVYIDRDGNGINENVLWDAFTEAVKGNISPDNFQAMLLLKGVRITKFSQVLFLINPEKFWSIDENSLWLPIYSQSGEDVKNGIENAGINKYLEVLNFIRSFFPNCKFYEINLLCWLLSGDEPQLMITENYCQISSKLEGSDGDDHYDEFVESSAVWPGDDGKHLGGYGLSKVRDGDIVLIRRGTRNLGGIGIIIQNEYETGGYTPDKAIYIIWLNKESRKLDYGLGDWKGFNEKATDDTYEKFYTKYSDTLDLIEKLIAKQRNLPFIKKPNNITTNNNNMPSLNTILYGPPGTGKTYNTIIMAAKIITSSKLAYQDAKKVYESLLGDQIEFITFHQNYSYEDFVLGLRPDLKKDDLKFIRHEGVFYKIAKRAKDNYSAYKEGLHPTEPSFETVFYEFLKPTQNNDTITVKMDVGGKDFYILNSSNNFLEFKLPNSDEIESLNIETLKTMYQNEISTHTEGKHIYYTPLIKQLRIVAEELKKEEVKTDLKSYVLIIDEINRANISRVFGELITLLEEDKRLGNKHEMTVTLSNGEKFSVPKNLYILGTMNTADKSIALIDIALRRRFIFENMYPRPELVDEFVKAPYNDFLKDLNEKILEKKGADFLIGHSYLMADEKEELDFLSAMNQKIIPLLNEYFYNHRSISILDLLQSAIAKVPGFKVDKDDYVGVVCKQTL